jgi:hypothetical protein
MLAPRVCSRFATANVHITGRNRYWYLPLDISKLYTGNYQMSIPNGEKLAHAHMMCYDAWYTSGSYQKLCVEG